MAVSKKEAVSWENKYLVLFLTAGIQFKEKYFHLFHL